MLNNQLGEVLSELLDKEDISEEERKRIIITSTALNMISIAVNTADSNHRLADEMNNLEKYVSQIEAVLK